MWTRKLVIIILSAILLLYLKISLLLLSSCESNKHRPSSFFSSNKHRPSSFFSKDYKKKRTQIIIMKIVFIHQSFTLYILHNKFTYLTLQLSQQIYISYSSAFTTNLHILLFSLHNKFTYLTLQPSQQIYISYSSAFITNLNILLFSLFPFQIPLVN